jgi:hypothetical protein
MRHRSNKDQYSVPQRRPVHFQLCETKTSRVKRVIGFSTADEDAYLAAGSLFRGDDRRNNSVVIDSLEKMMWFHAGSPCQSPTTARAATATITAATGKSTVSASTPTRKAAASASSATNPPDPPGPARS